MSSKVKVIVSVAAAVVLLTVAGAVTVMAQEEEPAPTPEPTTKIFMGTANTTGLLARVAEILGISQEDLGSAFRQAQQEMREEALIRALDKAVEKGRLTEEQANELKEWWQQKPEVLDPGLFSGARFFPALRGGHMGGGYKFMAPWGRHMRGEHRGWSSDNTT